MQVSGLNPLCRLCTAATGGPRRPKSLHPRPNPTGSQAWLLLLVAVQMQTPLHTRVCLAMLPVLLLRLAKHCHFATLPVVSVSQSFSEDIACSRVSSSCIPLYSAATPPLGCCIQPTNQPSVFAANTCVCVMETGACMSMCIVSKLVCRGREFNSAHVHVLVELPATPSKQAVKAGCQSRLSAHPVPLPCSPH